MDKQQSTAFADHYADYLEAGYSIIPVKGKRPWPGIPWKQYQTEQLSEADAEAAAKLENAGIGVVCGRISGVVGVDVDVDAREQPHIHKALAEVIPKSLIKKRGKKGYTAFFKTADDARDKPFKKIVDGHPVVELLGEGNQTVIPPSLHPDTGEPYEWMGDHSLLDRDELTELPEDFSAQVDKALAAFQTLTVLEGGSGIVEPGSKIPVSQLQVDHVRDALHYITHWAQIYEKWVLVGMALHTMDHPDMFDIWNEWSRLALDKYEKNEPGLMIGKWNGFSAGGNGITYKWILKEAQLRGWHNPMSGKERNRVEAEYESEEPLTIWTEKDLDHRSANELGRIPCDELERVAEWLAASSRHYTRDAIVVGALALASTLGGRYYTTRGGILTSTQQVLIAPSGSGKDLIRNGISSILAESGLSHLMGASSFTSEAAIRSSFVQNPSIIVVMDEFGDKFKSAMSEKNGSTYEKAGFQAFKEVYSTAGKLWVGRGYAAKDIDAAKLAKRMDIHSPAMTLVGLSTPGQFTKGLQGGHIEDGFLNRLIITDAKDSKIHKNGDGVEATVPQWLIDRAQLISQHGEQKINPVGTAAEVNNTAFDFKPITRLIEHAPGVAKWLFDQQDDIHDRNRVDDYEDEDQTLMADMTARWGENAMRIAASIAVFENPIQPVITQTIAEWALDYVVGRGHHTIKRLKKFGVLGETEHQRRALMLLEKIREAGADGMTTTAIIRLPTMKRVEKRIRDDVMESLLAQGDVRMVKDGKRKTYYAVQSPYYPNSR